MKNLPQLTSAQWDQLFAYVDKAVKAAQYMSDKLAFFQWLGLLSALVTAAVIYQISATQPWIAAVALLFLLLPTFAVFRARQRLQDVANAPQAIKDVRDAVASIPGTLREAGLDLQNGKVTFEARGGVFATLKQLRSASQSVSEIKNRFQELLNPEILFSLIAVSSPVFLATVVFAVMATVGLTLISAVAAVGWLIAQ